VADRIYPEGGLCIKSGANYRRECEVIAMDCSFDPVFMMQVADGYG